MSKIVSDLRVHLYGKNKCYDSLNNKSIEKRLRRNGLVKFNDNMKTGQILTLQIPINPSRPNLGRRKKINLIFHFYTSLWCLKSFLKALKAFIKPFEALQGSVKIKIQANFCFNINFLNA